MQWIKTLDYKKVLYVLLFVVVFLLSRLPRLGLESINPDAVNWHYRSEQFVVGIKHGLLEKTYQHYHPGVTLMWLTGIPIEIFKQVSGIEVYDHMSFVSFHAVAKYSLVFTQLILHLFLLFLLTKVFDFEFSLMFSFILSLEPFLLGNSRLFHMDILFTLILFITLAVSYLYYKEKKAIWLILSGIFCGMAFLTRSIGLGVLLYLVFGLSFFLYLKDKRFPKFGGGVLLLSVITVFALFPALWQKPIWTLTDIFSEGQRIGVRNGHTQIFFGQVTENPGPFFYPVVLLLKVTPFIIIGIILFAVVKLKTKLTVNLKDVSFLLYSFIFYLGYFVVMTLPTKKIDRYMLVLFPFMVLIATQGYYFVLNKKNFYTYATGVLFLLFVVIPVISYSPYNFTYSSPLFGSPENANHIVGQKSFGVGIYEVKSHLQKNYGSNITVGFIDTKPIKSIYPNSLVSDIRIDGTKKYEVLVLAINEEIPEKVLKTDVKFVKDSSLYINGLEYWRFYVKENQK